MVLFRTGTNCYRFCKSAIEAASISRQEDVNSQPVEQARLTELVEVETEVGLPDHWRSSDRGFESGIKSAATVKDVISQNSELQPLQRKFEMLRYAQ
jgi:hypothetical protein